MPLDITGFPEIKVRIEGVDPRALDAHVTRAEVAARLLHALRSPLQHLRRATGRMLEDRASAPARERIELADAAGQMIEGLLAEHLDLCRDHATSAVERAVFDLQDVLAPVIEFLAGRAWRRGRHLACRFAASVPPALVGDPARVRRATLILLEEGLRSAGTEGITLRVTVDSESDQEVTLRIALDGLEDDPDCAPGLAACARLAREMDGRLRLAKAEGQPGTASFSARFERMPERRRHRRSEDEKGRTRRLLLVNADALAREALAADLRERAFEVDTADTTRAAAAFIAGSGGYRAALISAEGWDCDELARQALAQALAPAPLFLSTRSSGRVPRDSERVLGVRDVINEPALPRELLRAVFQAPPGVRLIDGEEEEPRQPPVVEPLSALLAEGGNAQRSLAAGVVERLGHQVVAVADGLSAIARLEEQDFDLLLLDLPLPGLDGASIARLVRAREARLGGRVPIVALSDDPVEGLGAELAEAGVDACLDKPLEPEALAWTIARLCRGRSISGAGAA